jgi:uncharacterized protein
VAGSSFFMLLDDIAALLDDVAVMSKFAVKKTAGVLGDDLALNAQQVSGVNADRELPVVWAVAKGSFINKLILVPGALALSVFLPVLIVPLLMIGGAYLCFEGVEKIAHGFLHSKQEDDAHHSELVRAVANEKVDLVAFEKDKIKGAIRTDFILSAEIIVIALGTIAKEPLLTKTMVLSAVAVLMTVGVYGLVAGIVKLDDVGLYLSKASSKIKQHVGAFLLWFAPKLLRFLSIAGTAAMFLVGGSIIMHNVPALHHILEAAELWAQNAAPSLPGAAKLVVGLALEALVGILTGILCLLTFLGIKRLLPQNKAKH